MDIEWTRATSLAQAPAPFDYHAAWGRPRARQRIAETLETREPIPWRL